eukprot:65586_1
MYLFLLLWLFLLMHRDANCVTQLQQTNTRFKWLKILHVSTEQQLFDEISAITMTLTRQPIGPHKLQTRKAVHQYPIEIISNNAHLTITEQDALNPFSISQSLINLMFEWYSYHQQISNLKNTTKYHTISYLHKLINPFTPSTKTFDQMYILLTELFHKDFSFMFVCLYYFPYIKHISNDTLQLIGIVGEGAQSVVAKVKCRFDHQQVYALKLFKPDQKTHCCDEQAILLKMRTHESIKNVPEIYSTVHAEIINCDTSNAILMQFIDGKTLNQHKFADTVDHEKALGNIYIQMSSLIKYLASIGISHNDINTYNIIIDKNNTPWLIDFGMTLNIENNRLTCKQLSKDIIGTWLFYAPHTYSMHLLRLKLIKQISIAQIIILSKDVIREWTRLMINGNLYSLQAVLFHKLTINEELNIIYRKYNQRLWSLCVIIENKFQISQHFGEFTVCNDLLNMWKIRANMINH